MATGWNDGEDEGMTALFDQLEAEARLESAVEEARSEERTRFRPLLERALSTIEAYAPHGVKIRADLREELGLSKME